MHDVRPEEDIRLLLVKLQSAEKGLQTIRHVSRDCIVVRLKPWALGMGP